MAAGWEGILFISFAAILLLSAIGFLIYSYLTAQKRTLEFAVLRTMGFSRARSRPSSASSRCFVIGLGMIAGTLMGLRLGSLMIRYMGVTETGDSGPAADAAARQLADGRHGLAGARRWSSL